MAPGKYDVLIIGAGISGLACGTFLAKQGLRVGILEQHTVPGGYCHSFKRGPYIFDAAVEYIGCCGKNQDVTNALRLLGANNYVAFDELNPQAFDRIHLPQHDVDVCKGADRFMLRLADLFPSERRGLRRYFSVLNGIWKDVHAWGFALYLWEYGRFPSQCRSLRRYSGRSLGDLFNETIKSPKLRGILAGQSGNYALPPSQVDLAVHAVTIMHFHEGAYYPRGGVQNFSDGLARALDKQGGKLFLQTSVKRIRVLAGQTKGVELESGKCLDSRIVITSTDPQGTRRLLEGEDVDIFEHYSNVQYSLSSFQLYLGVQLDPRLGASNHWVSPSYDFEKIYQQIMSGRIHRKMYFLLSAMSQKDQSGKLAPKGHHVLKIITPVSHSMFSKWRSTSLGRRGNDYQDLKKRMADLLLDQASEYVPGLKNAIRCMVIGTPLTNVHYARAYQGAMYGIARTPEQSGEHGFKPRTSVHGLYLTGTNIYYPGVLGALGSGIMSGSVVLRELKISRVSSSMGR